MGNYKSATGQFENSGQLQNNSVNGAMLVYVSLGLLFGVDELFPGGATTDCRKNLEAF